jgi:WD40 repeat protein
MKVEQVPVAREIFFSADGKLLVTADGNSLIKEDSPLSASIGLAEVWEVASGNEIAEFRPFVGEVYSAALSPDGRRAATINQYGEIQLWDVGQSKEVWSARHSVNAWASLAFSPDGRHLFSIASDGTARVWSSDSGQELSRFGHGDRLFSGAIAPQSSSFAAAGDKSIERWQWETGKEDEACRRLTRNLNNREWKQYLGKEPYPRTCAELPENSTAILQGQIEQTPRKITLRKAETWWNRLLEVVPYKLIGFVILLRVVIWVLGGLPRAEKESGARNE